MIFLSNIALANEKLNLETSLDELLIQYEKNPDNQDINFYLSRQYMLSGKTEPAIEHLKKIYSVNVDHEAYYYIIIADLYENEISYDDKLTAYQKAYDSVQENAYVLYKYSTLLKDLGFDREAQFFSFRSENIDAELEAREEIKIVPNNAINHTIFANILEKLGNMKESKRLIDIAGKLNKDNPDLKYSSKLKSRTIFFGLSGQSM